MIRIFLLAAALCFVLSASADAATVTSERVRVEEEGIVYYVLPVRFEATPGEANDITVTIAGDEVAFDDAGAAIDAQGECTNSGPNRAVCSSPGAGLSLHPVLLGDGGDEIRIERDDYPEVRVRGGSGDDRIFGGSGTDYLFGGPGDDLVDGGPYADTINGGGGRDELRAGELDNPFTTDIIEDGDRDGAADADKIVGHPGGATIVSYRSRTRPLMIDLAAGIAGEAGERDTLTGITGVSGGSGPDQLLGSDEDDFISGNAGADRIRGEGGDDFLAGERGRDHIFGGTGDDTAADDLDDAVDVQHCGPGFDFVRLSDKRDRLRHTCEDGAWTSLPDVGELNRITAHPTFEGRRAIFKSTCHESPRCEGRIRLVSPGTRELLGSGRFRFRQFRGNDRDRAPRHDIVARLNERGLERLERGAYVRVVVVSRWDCGGCLNPLPPARTGFTAGMRR